MDLHLSGRRVLITGATGGIGRAIAQGFAAEGCDLVLLGRTPQLLSELRAQIAAAAPSASIDTRAIDLASPGAAEILAEEFTTVDILVNNAGAIRRGSLLDVDEKTWRAAWDLKVFGYINMTRAFMAPMLARGRGVIINVIGIKGERVDDSYVAGSSANASLIAFTRAVGSTSIDRGVRVVGVSPGWVETPKAILSLQQMAGAELGDPERWRELLKNQPRGKLISPEEIANVTTFVASDKASALSGHVITVDAGWAARA
jgi:NAD(P)-dependent dehydrogenase (short-subunit alcohol dehydrogenase family)